MTMILTLMSSLESAASVASSSRARRSAALLRSTRRVPLYRLAPAMRSTRSITWGEKMREQFFGKESYVRALSLVR